MSSGPSTPRSASTAAAASRSVTIITWRRGNRSTITPSAGPNSAGSANGRIVRPAAAFDPVSSFAQIPSARNIA